MKMTFRWYGSQSDKITLKQIKQIPGCTGLMGVLDDKAAGEVWEEDEIRALVHEVHEAGLELQYTCNAKPFCGWIDRQRLERAVWNLLSNTVKFTPRGGTITAELEYTFSAAVLRIHDSGEGVSPAQLTTAFQGYDRICALGDPRWGAGLGLPLAEHIVRLHGGTLMLHTSEGKGTTAVLSLSLSVPGTAELQFHSPTASIDYTGGYAHELVELSDVLPLSEFDSCRIN